MSKAVKKYLRQVRSWLPCSHKAKKRILTDVENIVSSYLAETPNCTISQLQDKFGTPQQIAVAHIEEMDTPELLHQLRTRKRFISIVAICAISIIIIWLGVALIALINDFHSANGYFVVEP